jgi:hypothetical protein
MYLCHKQTPTVKRDPDEHGTSGPMMQATKHTTPSIFSDPVMQRPPEAHDSPSEELFPEKAVCAMPADSQLNQKAANSETETREPSRRKT